MILLQTTINDELLREPVISLPHLRSIDVMPAGADKARSGSMVCETTTEEIAGIRSEYAVMSDGSACIVKCPEAARRAFSRLVEPKRTAFAAPMFDFDL